jgi:hypothetical protein
MSIRKLFASDRGLFANGGKSIMMGTRCLHCQSQRRADGSQAQVDTRKHDSLGCQAIRRSRLRRFGRRHCQGSGQAHSFRRREAAQGKSRFVGRSEHWCCNQRRLSIRFAKEEGSLTLGLRPFRGPRSPTPQRRAAFMLPPPVPRGRSSDCGKCSGHRARFHDGRHLRKDPRAGAFLGMEPLVAGQAGRGR